MASTTQDSNTPGLHNYNGVPFDGDAVVISGISCVMPGCHNIMEFADKLYGKVNMTKCGKSRWAHKLSDLPKYQGTIPHVDRFDAQFFMIFHSLGQTMDAMTRKLLEQSYQAVFDAGICPTELSGKSIGVIMATGFCETDKASADTPFGILGSNRSMTANRISYYLNLLGPSLHVDGDAAGSALALEKAYELIISGKCEGAIVGAGKLLLHPHSSLNHHKLVPFCPDGNIKSYDEKADGHVLSEGFTVIFLQKHKDAKRVYASIRHIKTTFTDTSLDGGVQKFTPYRDPVVLAQFFRDFYNEIGISPTDVEYVEGFGSAVPDADKAELKAIDEVFCKNRKSVLPVGSVMSNTGYTEAATCITGIMKLVLAYNRGKIASNINCDSPCQDVEGLKAGRLRILTEDESFGRSFAAVNNFSITGINAHVLLQGCYKPKDRSQYQSKIPYLMTVSGRQETCVQKIFDDIKSHPLDPEEITLLHNIYRNRIPKHLARGFGIYTINNDEQETMSLKEEIDYYDDAKRPLWFVYSGMGSQWAEMGVQLMRIPIFADAIMKCHKALESQGIDLLDIITCPDGSLFDDILNSFVGIAAIQIALTDVLTAIGLVPDNIIGHSVGELGCAYADGCVTAEEMILMAYSRGLVSKQTEFIRGSMAAIGIGFKQICNLIPPEIEVACHNGPDSCTISGPADIMKTFIAQLSARGIFAKEVSCSNIAYHSRYINNAGPGLLKYLKEIVKSPKLRSERWLSTSVPQDKWNEPIAKYSSAEYHTNNLLSPVLFEETINLVPYNAVLIEVAPHGLLQAILKRSLPETCKNIPLTKRGHKDNSMFLLEAIGKLYMEGFNVNLSALYPKIEFPVSTETRPLSHLIEWAYAEKYKVCLYVSVDKKTNSVYRPIITIYDEEYEYLTGNVINNKTVFPFSGALVFVWELLAMTVGKRRDYLSVKFKDITCHVQPILSDNKPLYLTVLLQKGSGRFEVTCDQQIIVDGFVYSKKVFKNNSMNYEADNEKLELKLTNDDIYELLFERGYHYKNDFRIIQHANFSFTHANLIWNDNWVPFLDGLLQMSVLRRSHNGISQPQYIKEICIDVMDHANHVNINKKNNGLLNAVYSEINKVVRCGGIAIEHLTFNDKPSLLRQQTLLKELKFVPFDQESNNGILETVYVYLQIVSENLNKPFLNVIYISESNDNFTIEEIKSLLNSPPRVKVNIIMVKTNEVTYIEKDYVRPDVILLNNAVADKSIVETSYHTLPSDTFIVYIGEGTNSSFFHTICASGSGKDRVVLAKWKPRKVIQATALISVQNDSDLENLRNARTELSDQDKLIIVATYPPMEGLKDLVLLWRSESGKNNIFVVMMNKSCGDSNKVNFPCSDLVFNVFQNGTWGGEYYVPIKEQKINSDTGALEIGTFGDLNTLTWVDRPNKTERGITVKVQYAGLNVYDAKRALAEISIKEDNLRGFGMDFSGVTERGCRVMGLIQRNAVSEKVIAQPELLWPVPVHWTLEDAATVPLPYCLAFYCLAIKSKLIRKMNVLIHGGAGALGQAAISICLANGCNVFTTVSNGYKKRVLRKLFPDLPDDNIGNSRDASFQDMIVTGTKGEGCHIIICSVSGELKEATLKCSGLNCTTIDIVHIHTQENFHFGMGNLKGDVYYSVIDFPSMFTNDCKDQMKVMVSEGIAKGYVRPLSRVTYAPEDTPRAFRLLSAGRHCGRVLINMGDGVFQTQPSIRCSRDACHLIFCDKDDFGLQIAEKLVSNGTNKLFIHSKKPSSYLEYKTLSWRKRGVEIHISHESICKMDQVVNLLTDCIRWASVEGIFIVETELNDTKSCDETKNLILVLDLILKDLCPSLRYFAVIHENSAKSFDREIFINRTQQGLHFSSHCMYDLEKFKDKEISLNGDKGFTEAFIKDNGLKWVSAVDGFERAILSNKSNIIVYVQPIERRSIIEEVMKIAGVEITDSITEDTTLEEIGVDIGKAQELCNVLEKIYNITIPKKDVPPMTISSLKTIQENETHDKKELNGLNAFINVVDSDELLTDCAMQIRTLVNTSELRPEEFDNKLHYLCIVPGLEGLHHRFHKLCERLKLPAIVLQPGFDVNDLSIEDMAQRLTQVLLKKLIVEEHFYLLGYEIGILLVMEMAQILEDRGLTGTIFCVGGTPEDICAIMQAHFGNTDPEQLQNQLIEHVYRLFTKKESDDLNMKIKNASNWKDKVEICIQMIHVTCSSPKQYLRSYINVIYNRIIMARDYVWKQRPLKSKIVILKARFPESSSDSKYNSQIAAVHELNSSLPYAMEDLKCSAIVNKYLDPKILDEFNNRNHCETVLINEMQDLIFNYIDDD